jgi:hypothetical protein
MVKKNKVEQYMKTYSGQKITTAELNKVAVWEIRGEDSNCDMGGAHHMPHLGTVQGKLRDVIEYAVELPGFWQWGGGGEFKEIKIQSIDDMSRKANLLREKADLKARIEEIDKELR